jgi:ABC-type antimicrobial peptide transport system permease subunit
VLERYFDEERTIDLMIRTSLSDPREHANYIQSLGVNQSQFNWIDSVSPGYRWQSPLFTRVAPENITLREILLGSLSFIYSVDQSFYQNFNHLFHLINGTFDIGPGKAVISENIANFYSIDLGENMSIFTWLQSTFPYQNDYLRTFNDTSLVQITGIVADNSTFFNRELIGDLSSGFYWISRFGCIFTGFTAIPDMNYYNYLRFQPTGSGITDNFDNLVFIKSKRGILDMLNPDSSIDKINQLQVVSREVVNPENTYSFIFLSPLKTAIEDYRFWLTSARIFLTVLSLPVILTGYYLLNFSFSHTFEERKKEISSIKSRGFSNLQVWFIVIFEALFLGFIGAIMGVILSILLNTVLETSTSFMVFDLSRINFDSIEAITPYTLIIAAATSIVIMIIITIIPVRSIINLPVDEITQEVQISETESFSFSQLKLPSLLCFTGLFIIVGLFSSSQQVSNDEFLILLALVGLVTFVIGSLTLMASIARFLPLAVEKLQFGVNSPHLYLVARELSRRSKKTTAAFIVLALTLAFGIFSSLTIQSSTAYLLHNSYFEVGSDVSISFRGSSGYGSIPKHNYDHLSDAELYPEIKSIVKILQHPGYILTPGESYPSSTTSIRNRRFNTGEDLDVVFINSTEYKSAYYQDYFIESNETDPITAIGENPGNKILIDRQTAELNAFSIGDTIRFTTGRDRVYEGLGVLVGFVDYFSPGLVAGEESFVIVDRGSLQDEFASAEFTSTSFMIELHDLSLGFEVTDRILKDRFVYGVENAYSVQEMTIVQTEDFSTLMQTLTLDFYYSLIVAAVGFFLVLEIRVQERKKEIGSIKALGMSNNQTISMIMLEGGVSILVASFTGFLTGVVSGAMIAPILFIRTLPPVLSIPFDIFSMQLLLAVIFAFFGTLIPAIQTNKWVPADLIKYEG